MNNKKIIIFVCLVLYAAIILLPPMIHGYIYPNQGDDSAYHLQYFESLTNGGGIPELYIGRAVVGQSLIGINQLTGIKLDVLFLWFNYFALSLVGISIYLLITYLTNWKAGLLSIPLVIFTSTAMLSQFNAGVIFSVITIGIFFPLFSIAIIKIVLRKNKLLWIAGILGTVGVFGFHSIALFNNHVIYSEPVPTLTTFIIQLMGVPSLILIIFAGLILWNQKIRLEPKQKIFALIMLVIIVGLSIGTFAEVTKFSYRLALYLAVIVALTASFMVGIVIKTGKYPYFAVLVTIFLVSSSLNPIFLYVKDNNTAIKDIDLEVIEYVNSLGGEEYSVSPEVAYWIYDRFIEGKEYTYGAYPYIERNQVMTLKTNPMVKGYYWFNGTKEIIPEGNVKRFKQGEIIIDVYTR